MRYAGTERLIILGKSEELSFLLIENGKIEIINAEHLRGLSTTDTQKALRRELGEDIECLVIGPAGENLVRYACIIHDIKNAAGRCGLGAVMGAKNLKAVSFHGQAKIPVANPDELKSINKKFQEDYKKSKLSDRLTVRYMHTVSKIIARTGISVPSQASTLQTPTTTKTSGMH